MRRLTLGFSPCPNDTFIFHALIHGLVDRRGLDFAERLEDVETLNGLVLSGALDVSKVSCHLLGFIRDEYCLLNSGGAIGRGCGPLLVARQPHSPGALRGQRIAVPGRYTTAHLLLRLYDPTFTDTVFMPFHEIMGAVADGRVAAGVIIHESRFTYASHGLIRLVDLGEWWEGETGLPIPLGGIVARRSLGREAIIQIDHALRSSVAHAMAAPDLSRAYVRSHAQELSEEVCAAHIDLYVNSFSVDLGDEGRSAIATLLGRAEEAGLVPRTGQELFLS